MAAQKPPPGISVQMYKKGEAPSQQTVTHEVPGSTHPTTITTPVQQPATVPPVPPVSPDGQELESGAGMEEQSTVPPHQIVPSIPAQAGEIEEPTEGEVIITGSAALVMAKMLDLPHIWNAHTGEPLSIEDALKDPSLGFIDFDAIRDSAEDMNPEMVENLMNALPMQAPKVGQDPAQVERSRRAFTKGSAGPGVTVRQIPGLIRVEVEGPVTLSKAKQGETRILSVKYKTVEAPTGFAGVKPQGVQVKRGHIQNPHAVTTRRRQIKPPVQTRQVPRRPEPEPEPPQATEPPEHEELIDEDYTF